MRAVKAREQKQARSAVGKAAAEGPQEDGDGSERGGGTKESSGRKRQRSATAGDNDDLGNPAVQNERQGKRRRHGDTQVQVGRP